MPFDYRGFSLNSAGDKDWAEREQALFKHLIDTALDRVPNGKYDATRAPGATDDSTHGFTPGSLWINGIDIYVCTTSAAGAADWDQVNTKTLAASSIDVANTYTYISGAKLSDLLSSIDNKIGELTRTGTDGVLHNFGATVAPINTDDASRGYEKGSMWEHEHRIYICTNNTTNAAVWEPVSLEIVQSSNVAVPDSLINIHGANLNELLSSIDNAVAKTKDYFSDFATHNVDDGESAPNVIYVGKMNKAGTWVIKRITGTTSIVIEYAMFENNPTGTTYATAWNIRNSLAYARLSEI
jgi:hypothetical protein